jgi:hypothetical protein
MHPANGDHCKTSSARNDATSTSGMCTALKSHVLVEFLLSYNSKFDLKDATVSYKMETDKEKFIAFFIVNCHSTLSLRKFLITDNK